MSDPLAKFRAPGKKRSQDVRNRSVRIRGLPTGTQEGLLQQCLEKLARVTRVEVFADKNEAIAELETPAVCILAGNCLSMGADGFSQEAGKLLLHPDPIVYNGNTLQLSEENFETMSIGRSAGPPPATTGGGLFIPRSAASRPRAGLGSKKTTKVMVSSTPTSTSSGTTAASPPAPSVAGPSKGQDDFRKMLGV